MSFEKNIFINYPFDNKYIDDLLKPMLYVIIKNGYNPRLAAEISDSGQLRLDKIIEIIKDCKYSIHDLSIVKSKIVNEYARMNMPFELGIDYGLRVSIDKNLNSKKFLILEKTKYDYQKAISDINGFDIKVHENDTQKLFDCLYTWCSDTLKINNQSPALQLFDDFNFFTTKFFDDKIIELGAEKYAKDYFKKLTIPEYILELKKRLPNK